MKMKTNFYRTCCLLLCFTFWHGYAQEQREDGFVWLTELDYMSVRGFSEGLAPVYNGEHWGYVNHEGEEIIQAMYSEAGPFKNGLAIVQHNNMYGVITKGGQQLFMFDYDYIAPFSDGFALAKRGGKQIYLKLDGTVISLSPNYVYHDFSDNMARIKGKKNWGYIDQSGKVVIDVKYKDAYDYHEGFATVKLKTGTLYYIDKKGRKQVNYNVVPGVDPNFNEEIARYSKGGKWGLVDRAQIVLPATYDEIGQLAEGYYSVKSNNVWGYIGLEQASISPRFGYAEPFSDGYACVKTIGKYGFIDKSGNMVIPDIFDQGTSMDNGYAIVEKDNRKGIIKLRTYTDAIADVSCGKTTIVDANGNNIIEAGEEFTISFEVKNIGSKKVKDIVINPKIANENTSLFTVDEEYVIGDIEPGRSTKVDIKVLASNEVENVSTSMEMTLQADNMFNSKVINTTIDALGVINSKLILGNYWFYTSNYDEIEVGDSVTFEARIKNIGKGIATDIAVRTAWPSYLLRSPKSQFSQEKLMPGESMLLKTSFVIDTTCTKTDLSFFTELNSSDNESQIQYLKMNIGQINKYVDLTQVQDSPKEDVANVQLASAAVPTVINEATPDDELLQLLDNVSQSMLNTNRFALVIGNENYSQQSVTYEQNVDFAKRDAVAFAEYAKKIMGVPENNVILLENATSAKMKQSISKLIKIADNFGGNAELLVFYAGHGQHDTETKETYLIPVDVSLTAPTSGIALAGLYDQLGTSKAAKVNVFLDACYSGVGRGIVVEVKESKVPGNMLVMTATSATQKSMPYKEKEHGLFTYYLLKTIGDNKGDITLQELYRNVNQEVMRNSIWINSSEQSPALIEGDALNSDWMNWKLK